MNAGRRLLEPHNRSDVAQRYNVFVSPSQQPTGNSDHARNRHRHSIYASETTGLLLIAFMLLALALIRYWHVIHWSLR
jgi:hypothetical protein